MSVQYLVDYENVHEAGMYGMDKLAAEDCVYIFHTSATDRISLSRLDNVRAWVKVIPVPPGKESLDKHLGSFLGYLIGKGEEDTRYAIISHDAGYRPLADFWNRSFQKADKVQCIHGINYTLGIVNPDTWVSIPADYSQQRYAIREFILRVYSKYANKKLCDAPCMLISELCSRLNSLKEYKQELIRTGKKPMKYLTDECRDILWFRRQWGQDWAFLLCEPVTDEKHANQKEELPKESDLPAEETGAEAEAVLVASIPPDEPASEEELPDIMAIGDLSIDDEPGITDEPEKTTAEETTEGVTDTAVQAVSGQDYSNPPFEPDPPAQQESSKKELTEADLRAIAEDCFRYAGLLCRNDQGHVRASWLRDQLKRYPEFRTFLKESGMKPIPYLQHLLEGNMEFYQEKGAYWVFPVKENELARKKRKFFEIAFRSIRQKLTDGGIDLNAADEIAGICMRANSETEPRKMIHTLLCQRFGNKTGAKYYRQAVKYISA